MATLNKSEVTDTDSPKSELVWELLLKHAWQRVTGALGHRPTFLVEMEKNKDNRTFYMCRFRKQSKKKRN